MKVLVLGMDGMAGHVMYDYLRHFPDFEVYGTSRQKLTGTSRLFLDVMNQDQLQAVLKKVKPDVLINCVGILNQAVEKNLYIGIYINSLLPHLLVEWSKKLHFRLIHISTDCVFSGNKGDYTEQDITDGKDLYAKTKMLGEVKQSPHLTIRTSIIGPELNPNGIGLFHWFMNQTGTVKGYTRAWWSGVTTIELAKQIHEILHNPKVEGLLHLTAPKKINKYDLLHLFKEAFELDIDILPDSSVEVDKSLVHTRSDYRPHVKNYQPMIAEMREWMIQSYRSYPYRGYGGKQ